MQRTMWGVVTVCLWLTSWAAAAGLNMKVGLWETTMVFQGKKPAPGRRVTPRKMGFFAKKTREGTPPQRSPPPSPPTSNPPATRRTI